MFNFFRPRTAKEFMEEAKEKYTVPPTPSSEKPAVTYYRLGLTDNNRVSLQMGYSEITMSAAGVDNLIKQLELFRNQLDPSDIDKTEETSN